MPNAPAISLPATAVCFSGRRAEPELAVGGELAAHGCEIWETCGEIGVGGGSRGPSMLIVGDNTEDGEAALVRAAASSSEKSASSSQESATGSTAFFGFPGAEVGAPEAFVKFGLATSGTRPLSPIDRVCSADLSSERGSDMVGCAPRVEKISRCGLKKLELRKRQCQTGLEQCNKEIFNPRMGLEKIAGDGVSATGATLVDRGDNARTRPTLGGRRP